MRRWCYCRNIKLASKQTGTQNLQNKWFERFEDYLFIEIISYSTLGTVMFPIRLGYIQLYIFYGIVENIQWAAGFILNVIDKPKSAHTCYCVKNVWKVLHIGGIHIYRKPLLPVDPISSSNKRCLNINLSFKHHSLMKTFIIIISTLLISQESRTLKDKSE